jgi:Type II secretion system (T2SS), protein E, N-terminal domain
MSSFESSGFPSPPAHPHAALGQDAEATEPVAPLAPIQPFDEVQPLQAEPLQDPFQPLQPLEVPPVESFGVKHVEPVQLTSVEPLQPLEPLPALEPLQPTMPPPLPLLTVADHTTEAAPPAPAGPAPSPEEVANLGVPLGTLIFRAGLLTEEQLEDALQEGVRSGKRLGEVLLESGLLDERDLGRLLADQKGLRFVELSSLSPDPTAAALLSAEKAHMYAALPVGFEDGVPLVAVADPSNELVTENLRRALGGEPRLLVASRSDLHATIDRLHVPVTEEPVAQAEPPVVEELPVPAPVDVAEPVEPIAAAPFAPAAEPETPFAPAAEPEAPFAPAVEPAPQPEPSFEVAPPEPAPQPEPSFEVAPLAAPQVEPALAREQPEPAAEPQSVAQPLEHEAHAPVPVLQPVEVEHVAPPQPETNGYATVAPLVSETPEPTPEPVAAEPEPVVLEPLALEEPAPEPSYSRVEEETAPQVDPEQELPSALSYEVALRLTDGERVPVGSFGDPQKAREYAREVVKHLSDDSDGWPFFSGRFLRPDTIVSVDIVPVGEPDRWLGSSIRSNWASRLNR